MKTDLTDVTFMIPIRVDSLVRLENLMLTVRFLSDHFNCHIIVLEADNYNNGIIRKMLGRKVEYYFVEDDDSVFYRTRYINMMTEKVKTPFLCIWDADVVVPVPQIAEAVGKMRTENFEVALPYDGRALDTSAPVRELFIQSRKMNVLQRQQNKMNPLHKNLTLRGGAVFVNTEAYKKAGMENLSFYGWGSEDFDRYERWTILGYKIFITKGVLYHLTHPRGENSTFSRKNQVIGSETALFRTRVSSRQELLERVK